MSPLKFLVRPTRLWQCSWTLMLYFNHYSFVTWEETSQEWWWSWPWSFLLPFNILSVKVVSHPDSLNVKGLSWGNWTWKPVQLPQLKATGLNLTSTFYIVFGVFTIQNSLNIDPLLSLITLAVVMVCVASFTMWHTSMVHHCQMSTSSNHPIHAIPALEATRGHKIPFFKFYIISLIEISTFKRKSRRSFTPCISFTIASSDWLRTQPITWAPAAGRQGPARGPLTNSWRQVYQSFICFNHSSNAIANQTNFYLEGGLSRSWQTSQWGMKPSPLPPPVGATLLQWAVVLRFMSIQPLFFFFFSLFGLCEPPVQQRWPPRTHSLPLGPFRFIGHRSWQATK